MNRPINFNDYEKFIMASNDLDKVKAAFKTVLNRYQKRIEHDSEYTADMQRFQSDIDKQIAEL